MRNMMITLAAGIFMSLSTGCMKVYEGDKVFSVQANKMLIGKSLQDAEAAIPSGGTVTTVSHTNALFGLVQMTIINGTK
ncbi:MAG: hypothetical protein CMK59_14175 [Proteobacteria bacterium]|nr:hypothetical protein [Pseudomonadota bacterium]